MSSCRGHCVDVKRLHTSLYTSLCSVCSVSHSASRPTLCRDISQDILRADVILLEHSYIFVDVWHALRLFLLALGSNLLFSILLLQRTCLKYSSHNLSPANALKKLRCHCKKPEGFIKRSSKEETCVSAPRSLLPFMALRGHNTRRQSWQRDCIIWEPREW